MSWIHTMECNCMIQFDATVNTITMKKSKTCKKIYHVDVGEWK